MEIDEEKLREFVFALLDELYKARSEWITYQMAHTLLDGCGLAQELDQFLEQIRKNPPPSPTLLADHQKAKSKIDTSLREAKIGDALKWFREYKPPGPVQ